MNLLSQKTCKPCEGGVLAMNDKQTEPLLQQLPQWQVDKKGVHQIFRIFEFKNYYQTIAFVNAIAWMTHQENHHPDLEVGYNRCVVRYYTHSIQGLSENDFICAAKVDALLEK